MAQAAEAGGGRRCGAGTGAALVVALVVERVSPAAQVHRRGLYKPPRTQPGDGQLTANLQLNCRPQLNQSKRHPATAHSNLSKMHSFYSLLYP